MSRLAEWYSRLSAAGERLRTAAGRAGPRWLTAPDPATGERWDRGQVLAHTAEMLPFWVAQVDAVVAARGHDTPFGRVSTDPGRLGAIERDRRQNPLRLLDRVDEGIELAQALLARLDERDLDLTGRHATRGTMTVAGIIEEFLVAHLEEHAEQLTG